MPHIHDNIDFTAEVFVVHENKVLLRLHDKYKIWLSVGGHIELHEDPNQAAIREVEEEVGLKVNLHGHSQLLKQDNYSELIPPRFMNRHRINEKHEHVTLVYFAYSPTDELIISEEEKGECKWFTMEELNDPKSEVPLHVKFYAKAALTELSK